MIHLNIIDLSFIDLEQTYKTNIQPKKKFRKLEKIKKENENK